MQEQGLDAAGIVAVAQAAIKPSPAASLRRVV
jgi:hypothetical protein